jgi:predicted O-linked N-acetylglucosamine transferase (SPINDLY family)
MRERLARAFDRFVDARDWNDDHTLRWIADQQIDIVVDMNGYTQGHRIGLWRRRPAPLQVNFLGYPGTSGLDCFDYILGDATVTPLEDAAHYAEQIVQLPGSYMPLDRRRVIAPATPSRAEEGLPDQGLVFACFNTLHKLGPEVFAVWLRLLGQLPGSVLWLLGENPAVRQRLRGLAQAAGVAPERLVFARRRPMDQHLARHRLADLFLDTLPYNAHTTTVDALYAGLPVLTCQGRSFAARVAASLLRAAGLPELVTHSLPDYEARALALATEPGALAALRERLLQGGPGSVLFDTPRYARGLESAYRTMVARWRQGLAPAPFVVTPT